MVYFKQTQKEVEEDLIDLNKHGMIAGPYEEKYSFFMRVEQLFQEAPVLPTSFPSYLCELYDIHPDHLEVIFSNDGLDVWEAGCTWILGNKLTIQLRKALRVSNYWLGMYSREEVLSHEAVHAVRAKFQEPLFEEILAYQTSFRSWRRFLGPLFRSPNETYFFLFSVLVSSGLILYSPALGVICSFLSPLYFGIRLGVLQYYFLQAKKKIRKMIGIPPLWVLLRLTDAEIRMFATQPIPVLERYIHARRQNNIRWQQIYLAYFS